MKHIHFLISLSIWLFAFIPAVLISYPVVATMLLLDMDMTKTIFGNRKYPFPVYHSSVSTPTSKFQAWVFYCLRNPVSNYGHDVLRRYPSPWEYTDYHVGFFTFNFGWKQSGTFKFRPRFKQP